MTSVCVAGADRDARGAAAPVGAPQLQLVAARGDGLRSQRRVAKSRPAMSTLQVSSVVRSATAGARTTLETCKVLIAGRDFGYPPLTAQPVAAGSDQLQLRCPDGTTRSSRVSVSAGETRTEVIR